MRNMKITVDELANRWSYLLYERGVSQLQVTENFKTGTKTFIVTGLQMEFENEYCFCYDVYKNEVLFENSSTLLLFLKENVKSVILIPVGDGFCKEILMFRDKEILIELAS